MGNLSQVLRRQKRETEIHGPPIKNSIVRGLYFLLADPVLFGGLSRFYEKLIDIFLVKLVP